MKTGRRDSKESYATVVEDSIPNHNDSMSLVLSRFQSIGIDAEGTVALLGMWLSQSTVYPLYILDVYKSFDYVPMIQELTQLVEYTVWMS